MQAVTSYFLYAF